MLIFGWGRSKAKDRGEVAPSLVPELPQHGLPARRRSRSSSSACTSCRSSSTAAIATFLCPVCGQGLAVLPSQRAAVDRMRALTGQFRLRGVAEAAYRSEVGQFWQQLGVRTGPALAASSPAPGAPGSAAGLVLAAGPVFCRRARRCRRALGCRPHLRSLARPVSPLPVPAPVAATPPSSAITGGTRIGRAPGRPRRLRAEGSLTDEEFAEAKRRLLEIDGSGLASRGGRAGPTASLRQAAPRSGRRRGAGGRAPRGQCRRGPDHQSRGYSTRRSTRSPAAGHRRDDLAEGPRPGKLPVLLRVGDREVVDEAGQPAAGRLGPGEVVVVPRELPAARHRRRRPATRMGGPRTGRAGRRERAGGDDGRPGVQVLEPEQRAAAGVDEVGRPVELEPGVQDVGHDPAGRCAGRRARASADSIIRGLMSRPTTSVGPQPPERERVASAGALEVDRPTTAPAADRRTAPPPPETGCCRRLGSARSPRRASPRIVRPPRPRPPRSRPASPGRRPPLPALPGGHRRRQIRRLPRTEPTAWRATP